MGLLRKLRNWREREDGTLEGPALSTESIVDAQDGQAWETLRVAGFEKGDIIPISAGTTKYFAGADFTNTSNSFVEQTVGGSYLPASVSDIKIRYVAHMKNDTAGETTYTYPKFTTPAGRPHQATEAEVSVTGTTGDFADSGWVDYQGPDDEIHLWDHIEGRVTGGTGTISDNKGVGCWFGVKL